MSGQTEDAGIVATLEGIRKTLEMGADDVSSLFLNCRNYWLGYASIDRTNIGMTLYSSGVADAQLNGVMWSGSESVREHIADARRRLDGLPWAWWVGPDSHGNTAGALLDAGAVQVGSAPVMVIDTERMTDVPTPDGVSIEIVPPAADLSDWVRAYAPAMNIAASEIPAMIKAEFARTDRPGKLTRFAARLGERIVAVSELYMSDGVAGIYLVATDAGHRRQGLGAAVTAAAVRLGRERGARLATLQATPLGRPLYHSLGFTTAAEYKIFAFLPQ